MTTRVAVVMAAGLGTRMRSDVAKVLHPALGRPMVRWVVDAVRAIDATPVVVLHHQADAVRTALQDTGARFALQTEPKGTGDAVRSALTECPTEGTVLVLSGDAPLVRPATLLALEAAHASSPGRKVTLVAAELDEPGAYGRVIEDDRGLRIVEAHEATPEQARVRRINTGTYAFDAAWLHAAIAALKPHPPKGELYLTDLVEQASRTGAAGVMVAIDAAELMGVNDRWALAEADRVLRLRQLEELARAGVSFEDPWTTRVEPDVRLERDVVVGAGVHLLGRTTVGARTRIGAHCVLEDMTVGPDVDILPLSHLQGSTVERGARVGPFARLREGAVIGAEAHIGNFVEVKRSTVGARTKAHHLAYVGDGTVGAGTNIGAGTIFCNYDGFEKHPTVVGEGAFIGSNSTLVAPVTVGAGAVVGAGSVITQDVPAEAMSVARAPQDTRPGAAARRRERRSKSKGSGGV